MADFFKVDDKVIEIAQTLIKQYHPSLTLARIAFVFRDEVQSSNGKEVWGQASKVTPKYLPYVEADFLIWIAEDKWKELPPKSRMALIDHELCHCSFIEGSAKMRPHDIEEFNEIIERWGFWLKDIKQTAKAVQQRLDLGDEPGVPQSVNVFALDPSLVNS